MSSSKDFLRSRLRFNTSTRNQQQYIAKEKMAEGREKSPSSLATDEERVSVVEYTDELEASKYSH